MHRGIIAGNEVALAVIVTQYIRNVGGNDGVDTAIGIFCDDSKTFFAKFDTVSTYS